MSKSARILALWIATGVGPVLGGTYLLDFSDGLLPSAHGWTANVSGMTEGQAFSVSNGVLTGDTTAVAGENVAYYKLPNGYDPTYPAVFEIRARHVSGGEEQATGIEIDGLQFWTTLGLGTNYVGVSVAQPQLETLIGVADTSAFHVYRLEMAAGTGALQVFVDGVSIFQGLPRQQVLLNPSVAFGDLTGGGDGKWEIDSLYYSNDPVPEPGTLWSLGLGMAALVARLRLVRFRA